MNGTNVKKKKTFIYS